MSVSARVVCFCLQFTCKENKKIAVRICVKCCNLLRIIKCYYYKPSPIKTNFYELALWLFFYLSMDEWLDGWIDVWPSWKLLRGMRWSYPISIKIGGWQWRMNEACYKECQLLLLLLLQTTGQSTAIVVYHCVKFQPSLDVPPLVSVRE